MFIIYNSLNEIAVIEGNNYFCSENGVLFNNEKTILYRFPLKGMDTYSAPICVKRIKNKVFKCCLLKTIKIPKSIWNLDTAIFYGCSKVLSVDFE